MPLTKRAAVAFLYFFSLKCAFASDYLPIELTMAELTSIAFDSFKSHEITPVGVPNSYDWAKGPRIGAGNKSNGFTAATGWGQAFYAKGMPNTTQSTFAVRKFRTLLCTTSPAGMEWSLVQQGAIEGREFRADFVGNASTAASRFITSKMYSEVSFRFGAAFHFWPKAGRFDLSSSDICGFLIYLEAKQLAGPPQSVVLGLGADYWTTRSAKWDNYRTNKDIAIGRLKVLSSDWQHIGLTTAMGDALGVLKKVGYIDLTGNTAPSNKLQQ